MIQLNYTGESGSQLTPCSLNIGMLETTRIRREGYAVRPPFKDFLER